MCFGEWFRPKHLALAWLPDSTQCFASSGFQKARIRHAARTEPSLRILSQLTDSSAASPWMFPVQ